MLTLRDRGRLGHRTVFEAHRRDAHLLARIEKDPVFDPISVLDDGPYPSMPCRKGADRRKDRDGIPARIIEYTSGQSAPVGQAADSSEGPSLGTPAMPRGPGEDIHGGPAADPRRAPAVVTSHRRRLPI